MSNVELRCSHSGYKINICRDFCMFFTKSVQNSSCTLKRSLQSDHENIVLNLNFLPLRVQGFQNDHGGNGIQNNEGRKGKGGSPLIRFSVCSCVS